MAGEEKRLIDKISGGFGHTLCLTEQGELFGWGLNVKGQVGLSDLPEGIQTDQGRIAYCKSVLKPFHIQKSAELKDLPQFKEISCGFSRSFAIDVDGNAWAWGGGCLGFKDVIIIWYCRNFLREVL